MNAKDNQSSITIGSYFDSWPKDCISQVVCGVFNVKKRGKVNRNTFMLSIDDIFILNRWVANKRTAKVIGDSLLPVITKQSTFFFRIKESIRRFFTSTSELFPYNFSNDLLQFINEFKPDFIYSTVDRAQVILLLDEIRLVTGAKIAPHFMDDFPTTIFKSPLTLLHRKYILNKLYKLIKSSKICFCISNSMCEEYKKRYKRNNFYILMNCVEKYQGNIVKYRAKNDKYVFFYAGGLHLKRDSVLLILCNYLSRIIERDIVFNIYTSVRDWEQCKDSFSNFSFINYRGYQSVKEINLSMLQSDVLVFLESFDQTVKEYTKYSISTKIPEYLSTGVKILAIGPPDIGSIAYLKNNDAAYVIDDITNDEIFDFEINKLFSGFRNEDIIRNASNLFHRNHTKAENVKSLQKIFINCK